MIAVDSQSFSVIWVSGDVLWFLNEETELQGSRWSAPGKQRGEAVTGIQLWPHHLHLPPPHFSCFWAPGGNVMSWHTGGFLSSTAFFWCDSSLGVGGAQATEGGRRWRGGSLPPHSSASSVCIALREKKEVSKLWQTHWAFSSCSGSCRAWAQTHTLPRPGRPALSRPRLPEWGREGQGLCLRWGITERVPFFLPSLAASWPGASKCACMGWGINVRASRQILPG